MNNPSSISIKTKEELAILREGGRILSEIIHELTGSVKSGMSTQEVDDIAEKLILKQNVIPAFKGYRGFPGCACISVNHEVVHGIPGDRVLNEGDIASVDVGIIYKDYYSDTATTIPVGSISSELKNLLNVTKDALYQGIEQTRADNHLSDISAAIQRYVESHDFSIVKDFVGHGIGKNLHEDPEIPNYGPPHQGPLLKEGMVFAIEPMVNLGRWETKILEDGWTVSTADGQPSAHFEHTVAITDKGPEVLTEYRA